MQIQDIGIINKTVFMADIASASSWRLEAGVAAVGETVADTGVGDVHY